MTVGAGAEYGFFWYFYQDGGIQHEVKLTGILSTNGLSEGEGPQPDYGVLMAPHLNAQIHQHFFNVRLDMAVDDPSGGSNLQLVEVTALLLTRVQHCTPNPQPRSLPHFFRLLSLVECVFVLLAPKAI